MENRKSVKDIIFELPWLEMGVMIIKHHEINTREIKLQNGELNYATHELPWPSGQG